MSHRRLSFRLSLIIIFSFFSFAARALAGDILYVTNNDTDIVSVIDAEKGVVVREVNVGTEPCDIVIDPKGDTIAVSHGGTVGDVWFIDRQTLKPVSKVLLAKDDRKTEFFSIAFSRDSKKLYAANQFSGFLFVIDVQKALIVKKLDLKHGKAFRLESAVLSPDGALLYLPNGAGDLPNGAGGEIFVVDAKRDEALEPIAFEGNAAAIAFSPDGNRLYVANGFGPSLDVMDMKTGAVIKRIPVGNIPLGVAVSKDGSSVFVSNKLSYDISVIDAALLKKTATIPVGMYPIGIAVSDDGKRVYVCNYNEKTVSIIDAASAKEILRVATDLTPLKIAVHSAP